jgi:hypothetical protein
VSEHRGRVSAEKRNERNERPMSGVPAKTRSVFVGCMSGVPAKTHSVLRGVQVHSGEEALTQ